MCVCVCVRRYVDVMNNRQTPDTSAGAFLTAVLEVQNKQWTTAKGERYSQGSKTTAARMYSKACSFWHLVSG